jgi:hypothetical protein
MEVSGQIHAPTALHPGIYPPVPIRQEAGWAQQPVWTLWRGKVYCPRRDSKPGRLARSLVGIPTELLWLSLLLMAQNIASQR